MKKSIYTKLSKTHMNEIIAAVLVILASTSYLYGFTTIGFIVPVVYLFYFYYMNVLKDIE